LTLLRQFYVRTRAGTLRVDRLKCRKIRCIPCLERAPLESLFQSINDFFRFIQPISDGVWNFPLQFVWYTQIPLLGQLSFAVLLLTGTGIWFTLRTGFVQALSARHAVPIMRRQRRSTTGISPLASFLLGLAMRVGPGNIVGVTGAIAVGGPGALFWMWVAAGFGMATAFMESVLAQLFKESKNDEYVGGMPYYGQRLLGDRRWVGVALSVAFITYALFNVPAQTFNVFTAIGMMADTATGMHFDRQSGLYYGIAIVLVISCAWLILHPPRDPLDEPSGARHGGRVLRAVGAHHPVQSAAGAGFLRAGAGRRLRAGCPVRRQHRHCTGRGRAPGPDVQRGGPGHHHHGGRRGRQRPPL
jgi:hypothetical protein